MAGKRRRPNGTFEYVFKRSGVLDKPLYFTFDSEKEGDAFAANLDKLLSRGIVPQQFTAAAPVQTLADLIADYRRNAHPSRKDIGALGTIERTKGKTPPTMIDAAWVDAWIASMKRESKAAPATIRAKVGALARCCDWGMRLKKIALADHPFRTLPSGYSQYTDLDAAIAGVKRTDIERDRRLEPGEHEKVLEILAAGVLPRKQRPLALEFVPALRFMFMLAQDSAMRLREMYTLTLPQVDVARRTFFLDKTKNGSKRQVPMSSVVVAELNRYLKERVIPQKHSQDALFPWWNGSTNGDDLHRLSDRLSNLWVSIFDAAACPDLGIHDLRHEATSRLFERTNLSDIEIAKITGHRSPRMLMRYANLRASSLSQSLW
jgi:integrase